MAKLPRLVALLGFVSLLNDFASEMVYPLLPAFVTGVLGAGAVALGTLDGAAEFAAAFVKFASGRASDRSTRRSIKKANSDSAVRKFLNRSPSPIEKRLTLNLERSIELTARSV